MATLDEAVFTAGDLMTRDVAVVHTETSLLQAASLLTVQQEVETQMNADKKGCTQMARSHGRPVGDGPMAVWPASA
jgi:hypothetical protein